VDTAARTASNRIEPRATTEGAARRSIARALVGVAWAIALALPRTVTAGLPGLSTVQWSLSALGGATRFDSHLTDYRWNADPRAAWGLQATGEAGRWMLGARALRTQTTQSSGIPGETSAPRVRLTSLEGLGGMRLATLAGVELFGALSGGWAHLGYAPDRMTFTPLSSTTQVEVHFAPIDTWTAAVGLWLRRPIASSLALGLQLERSYFALDTAHRNGATVEEQSETFGNWAARVELSWILGAP
jgi:hypothetical protein